MATLFSDFNLNKNLLKSIDDIGFTKCTPIQEEALTYTLKGHDIFAQSQTGTGKTAAFLISIFEIIERSEYREQALILCPTRELATQIEAEAKLLSVHNDYSILSIYGGVKYDKQESTLKDGVDIVIGTPGRIIDLSNKGTLHLQDFTIAVIDEADRMFDMGFVGDIRKILKRMPDTNVRQTMLFSATLDYSVKRLANEYMFNPVEIVIEPDITTVSSIKQMLYHVGSFQKMKLLLGILKRENAPRVIIFANTKIECEELDARLRYNGFQCKYLTGDLPQNKRQRIVNEFKENKIPILIATDVAARGIHVDNLELVINYGIPQHAENYVHRIGRTARAGNSGTAITFACEKYVEYLQPVEEFIGFKIPSTVACEDDFSEDKSEGRSWRRLPKAKNGNNSKASLNKSTRKKTSQKKSIVVKFDNSDTKDKKTTERKVYKGNPKRDNA